MTSPVAELNTWTHITLVVTDTTLKYYRRNTGQPESSNLLLGDLYTPKDIDTNVVISKLNSYYSKSIIKLPTLYNYFSSIEGVRFFLNGDSTYIANVTIKALDVPTKACENINYANNVKVYPTITSDYLTIDFAAQTLATIYNINGSLLKKVKIEGKTFVNVSDLNPGMYFVLINQKSYKFIVK
jgi:hypothetical protein